MGRLYRLSIVVTASLFAGCATPQPASTWEGLALYPQKTFDALYVRSGARFDAYTALLLEPVTISFDRKWDPDAGDGTLRRANPEAIKAALAQLFQQVFTETLQADGRFEVVDAPGANVLLIAPAIVDLYITAPDLSSQTASITRTYTVDAGEMTLQATIADSQSGTALMRVVDTKRGSESGLLQITNAVTNTAEARRAFQVWAVAIRERLELLRDSSAVPLQR
jgi:hypothetical protein